MELVARDARAPFLPEVADRADKRTNLVVLGDSLPYSRIGGVNAVSPVERRKDVVFALELQQLYAVFVRLEGNLHILVEEAVVALSHGFQQFHVLDAAVDHRAAVGRDDAVGEVEAALDGALEQRAARLAQEARHVVGRDVHRAGVRRGQADGKGSVKVHQWFGGVLAHERDADLAVFFRLNDQLVVCLPQEVFKIAKILQISHCFPPLNNFAVDLNDIILTLLANEVNLFIHFVHICINCAGGAVQYAPRAGAVHARTLIIQPPAGVLCRNAAVRINGM